MSNKVKNLKARAKNILVSLKFSILTIFISIFIITVLAIIFIRSVTFTDEVNYTSATLMKYVSDAVLRELSIGIKPVEMECEFTANLLQSDVLKENEEQLVAYTYYLVKTMPLVRGAFWGNELGNFIYSSKESNGTISSEIIVNSLNIHKAIHRDLLGHIISTSAVESVHFDPRLRPWYRSAKQEKQTIWTDIYSFYPNGNMGITAASPVYTATGKLRGVFGADISLDYLTRFVTDQKVSKNGYSFIVTKNENLVAYPERFPFIGLITKPGQLIKLHQLKLPMIDQSIDLYKKTGKSPLIVKYAGQTYLISYQSVPDLISHNWLIGVVTPRSDFTDFLYHLNLITLTVSFILLLLSILIVSNLVSRIVKPIHLLVKETDRIKNFELEHHTPIHSRIREVVRLRDAIRAMKKGLKHFQLYLPKTLVQQLITSGQDVEPGGERKQLVVLFSDIEGFTGIAERIDANLLMKQMCEYFEALSSVITDEKGTIDKYIGDSIMAFWGAPLPEHEPWYHAAKAALLFQDNIAILNRQWKEKGWPVLETRIGIHMGEAIVGNIGSSERLNYTALGDTINITSRLENINKIYKTKIIVSDVIYQLIKSKFNLRMLDCVMIAGRTKRIYIYELLGSVETPLVFNLQAYTIEFDLGFHCYQLQHWNDAINHFEKCLQIHPADNLAPIFLERCQQAQQNDPHV